MIAYLFQIIIMLFYFISSQIRKIQKINDIGVHYHSLVNEIQHKSCNYPKNEEDCSNL